MVWTFTKYIFLRERIVTFTCKGEDEVKGKILYFEEVNGKNLYLIFLRERKVTFTYKREDKETPLILGWRESSQRMVSQSGSTKNLQEIIIG